MEDDHFCMEVKLNNETGEIGFLAGLFDGHGGKKVSKQVCEKFPKIFLEKHHSGEYKDIQEAMYHTFMKCDNDFVEERWNGDREDDYAVF